MFSANSLSSKKLYLLYNGKDKHYNVITNLKGVWPRSTYVTDVTLSKIIRTSVTKFVPYALVHHPVRKVRNGIVLHVTLGFSVRNVSRIM